MHPVLVALASFVVMEPVTALTHRCVMHGPGRVLHRSHHRPVRPGASPRRWEANDLYPVGFASVVIAGFAIGFHVAAWSVLVPVGCGVTAYGAAYAVVHDAYVHRRLPLFGERRLPVLERLGAAHRIHHRHGGAPYGMLLPVVGRQRRTDGLDVPDVSDGEASPSGSRPSHEPLDA